MKGANENPIFANFLQAQGQATYAARHGVKAGVTRVAETGNLRVNGCWREVFHFNVCWIVDILEGETGARSYFGNDNS